MSSQAIIADDVRAGKTSASSFSDDRECLGRRNLINALPPEMLKAASDEYADYGNAVHKALETGNTIPLDEDQDETYRAILAGEETLLNEWALNNQLEVIARWGREERLWIKDKAGNPITSAQLDRYWIATPHALIIDAKSLFAPRLPRAKDSWQLRVQAVCLWIETGCDQIRAAYNCPNKFGRKLDYADFTLSELERDLAEIRLTCWRMTQPDAPRTPGDACRYCAARGVCPEAAAYSMLPSVVAQTAALDTKDEVKARVAMLTPADWAFIFKRSSIVKNILDAAVGNLKALDDATLASFGIRKGSGRTTSEVPGDHVFDACGKLVGLGLPESELWKCLSLNKTAVVALIMKEHGLKKGAAEAFYDSNLAEHISAKTSEAILREI